MTKIELTDDFHQDEPLGYLVKNYSDYGDEYRVFEHEASARQHARQQEFEARDDGEPTDFEIYPLYAGNPIRLCRAANAATSDTQPMAGRQRL